MICVSATLLFIIPVITSFFHIMCSGPKLACLHPQDRRQYVTRIDVDDKYADEIVREIMSSKQVELDSTYWTHRSLTFTTQYGQKNTVDIYPLTPFLASGEEILWQSLKADINDKNKKVIWIDAVTNYRIFQYSYQKHKGAVILFPSVEDVKISNEVRGMGLGQYNSSSLYLTGIQPSGATGIFGDVIFYSNGSPGITFTQVNDPETLSTVVRTLNQQQSNVRIGNGESGQTKDHAYDELRDTIEDIGQKSSTLSCSKYGNINLGGSNFCNNCGSPLSPSCTKCGHSNPFGALFCGKCGSKVGA